MSRSIPPRGELSDNVTSSQVRHRALTPRGRQLLLDRVAELRAIQVPELLAAARAAPDDGRPSADYVRLLGQLWDLERLLRETTTVAEKAKPGVVELGDLVTIEYTATHGLRRRRTVERYLLVHPAEAPLDRLRISVESPLARAVLGQPVGARVEVNAPAGRYAARIVATEVAPDGLSR